MQMNRKTVLWIIIIALFMAVLFLTFKAGSVNTVNAASQAVSASQSSASAMVGGC